MPFDTILQLLIVGQQFWAYLTFIQYTIEKFHLCICERQQPGQKIASVFDEPFAETRLLDPFYP